MTPQQTRQNEVRRLHQEAEIPVVQPDQYSQSGAGGGSRLPWWGKITACDSTTKLCKVKQTSGTLTWVAGSTNAWTLTEPAAAATEIVVALGESFFEVGDFVRVKFTGVGINPPWMVDQATNGVYTWQVPAAADLATTQDNPGTRCASVPTITTCCDDSVALPS